MAKLTVLRGYSGSGKSTYARQLAQGGALIVSRDTIRPMLTGTADKTVLTPQDENFVTQIENNLIRTALRAGRDVIVDNTNLVKVFAQGYLTLAVEEGATWEVKDFLVDAETCIFQNNWRTGARSVSAEVIESQAKRFPLGTWPTLAPRLTVAPTVPCEPYVPDPLLPPTFVFDIDGTLSLLAEGYSPYDPAHYLHDTVNKPVRAALLAARESGFRVVALSGREGTVQAREDTLAWLDKHDLVPDALFMRASGDKRNDAVVKSELFDQFVAPEYNVLAVYDDRVRVCRMWRARGITCFQVADGNF